MDFIVISAGLLALDITIMDSKDFALYIILAGAPGVAQVNSKVVQLRLLYCHPPQLRPATPGL